MGVEITELLVADLMSDEIVTCARDANLGVAAATLARHGVHELFLRDQAGEPVGVVTDFDLLAGEWLADNPDGLRTMRTITAGELMTSPVESIAADRPAAEAATRMRELHLSRLLVTGPGGSPVGVISVSDLVAPLGRVARQRRCVADVMSRAIVTCTPETSLQDASRAMRERRSRSIVAVNDGGRAIGVITGSDLLSLYQADSRGGTVADAMSEPITCAPELSLSEAADLLIRHEIHRLVVVDSSRPDAPPLGILSSSDIVAEMAHENSAWR